MADPVLLAPGVWRLPTLGRSVVNSFALADADGGITLVDAGLRGATRRLVGHLAAIGSRPDQVRRIVATHAHFDHVGDARRLRETTGASLCIHEEDAVFCSTGKAPPLDRSSALTRILSMVPQAGIGGAPVDQTFADNQLLDVAGGLRVVHTPGHTPGHCSLLHEPSGVLITGDSLFNWRSRMRYSYKLFCTEARLSVTTADRLGEVDYEIVAFTHGPEIRHRARDAVRDFLRSSRRA
jgi:glyoxylase-like metal-dependent hydrolase (beta-lactamase superfamily II)